MTVVITAGHSNEDLGAVYDNTKEADFCADMRNYVAFYLRNWGIQVKTDGEGRTNAPLRQAVLLAKNSKLALEFHLNASENKTAYGIEVLALEKHKKIAQEIAYAIKTVTGSRLRGDEGYRPQNAGQHARLGFVSAGGLVVELEFLSNSARFNILNEKRWLVAKAIAEVIKNYLQP